MIVMLETVFFALALWSLSGAIVERHLVYIVLAMGVCWVAMMSVSVCCLFLMRAHVLLLWGLREPNPRLFVLLECPC